MSSKILFGLLIVITISTGWASIIIDSDEYIKLCQLVDELIVNGMEPAIALDKATRMFISQILSENDDQPQTLERNETYVSSFRTLTDAYLNIVNEQYNGLIFLGKLNSFISYLLSLNTNTEMIDTIDSEVNIIGKRSTIEAQIKCDSTLPIPEAIRLSKYSLNQEMVDKFLDRMEAILFKGFE